MALAISIYSITDLISLFFTSLPLPAALVKHHAPIKCLLFQLSPLPPSPRFPCSAHSASICVHPVQVQLHVMFFVICHMQLLD